MQKAPSRAVALEDAYMINSVFSVVEVRVEGVVCAFGQQDFFDVFTGLLVGDGVDVVEVAASRSRYGSTQQRSAYVLRHHDTSHGSQLIDALARDVLRRQFEHEHARASVLCLVVEVHRILRELLAEQPR